MLPYKLWLTSKSCHERGYKRNGDLKIEAFSDSNYISDQKDQKSTCDCIYVRGNLVLGGVSNKWLCHGLVLKQSIV